MESSFQTTGFWSSGPGPKRYRSRGAAGDRAPGQLHPLGRIATIGEVTDAVLCLAKSDYVTGTVMSVDGGFSAGK
jgi:NAD(P)-dependent dehydrogenase (short-subunit alcohol dehydrogenase family)